MKKLFLLFVLLSSTAFAQTKFIEVLVNDTISLKPKVYSYNITENTSPMEMLAGFTVDDENDLAEEEQAANELKEIQRQLEAEGYKVMPLQSTTSYPPLSAFSSKQKGLSVIINSADDLEKISGKMENFEKYDSSIEVIEYANADKAEEQLIKKLMDKAKASAAIIAANTGMKVGNIVEVREVQAKGDFSAGMESWFLKLLYSADSKFTNNNGSLSKSFLVKFAAQ